MDPDPIVSRSDRAAVGGREVPDPVAREFARSQLDPTRRRPSPRMTASAGALPPSPLRERQGCGIVGGKMECPLPSPTPRLLRINEVAAETGLTHTRDPLLRGDGPARAGRPLGRRLPPVRRLGSRAPRVHPQPARRRRASRSRRSASCSRTMPRASAIASASGPTGDPAERRAIVRRRPGAGRAPDRDPRGQGRPARDDDRRGAGAPAAPRRPSGRARRRAIAASRPHGGDRRGAEGRMIGRAHLDPRRLSRIRRDARRSAIATTGCSSPARRSRSSAPGCSRSPRPGSSSS